MIGLKYSITLETSYPMTYLINYYLVTIPLLGLEYTTLLVTRIYIIR